jgi:hypothetical protein
MVGSGVTTDDAIVRTNSRALGAIYFSAMAREPSCIDDR